MGRVIPKDHDNNISRLSASFMIYRKQLKYKNHSMKSKASMHTYIDNFSLYNELNQPCSSVSVYFENKIEEGSFKCRNSF